MIWNKYRSANQDCTCITNDLGFLPANQDRRNIYDFGFLSHTKNMDFDFYRQTKILIKHVLNLG